MQQKWREKIGENVWCVLEKYDVFLVNYGRRLEGERKRKLLRGKDWEWRLERKKKYIYIKRAREREREEARQIVFFYSKTISI